MKVNRLQFGILLLPFVLAMLELGPISLVSAAPITLPSGVILDLTQEQVEAIKRQPGVFFGAEGAHMLSPGDVVVALSDDLGGGYLYGRPEHLAKAFDAAGATQGSAEAEYLFVKKRFPFSFPSQITLTLHTCAKKTRKRAPDVPAHRLRQVEAYFTVREVLSEASTAVPPKAGLSRERSGFCRCRYATLGLILHWF
jgi:hypothetical protein